jgi:hypothetical protein
MNMEQARAAQQPSQKYMYHAGLIGLITISLYVINAVALISNTSFTLLLGIGSLLLLIISAGLAITSGKDNLLWHRRYALVISSIAVASAGSLWGGIPLAVVLVTLWLWFVRRVLIWARNKSEFVPPNTLLIYKSGNKLHKVFGPGRILLFKTPFLFIFARLPLGTLMYDQSIDNVPTSGSQSLEKVTARIRFRLCPDTLMEKIVHAPNYNRLCDAIAAEMRLPLYEARQRIGFWETLAHRLVEQELAAKIRSAVYSDRRWEEVMERSFELGGLAYGPEEENMLHELRYRLVPDLRETLGEYALRLVGVEILEIVPFDSETVRRSKEEIYKEKRKTRARLEVFQEQGLTTPELLQQMWINELYQSNLVHRAVVHPYFDWHMQNGAKLGDTHAVVNGSNGHTQNGCER